MVYGFILYIVGDIVRYFRVTKDVHHASATKLYQDLKCMLIFSKKEGVEIQYRDATSWDFQILPAV